jgi:hypothetical protein
VSKGLCRVEQLLSRVRGTCPKFSGCALAPGRAGIGVNGVCSEDRSLQVLQQGPSITGFSPSSGMPKGAGSVLGQHFSKVTDVRLDGTSASHLATTDNAITAYVPYGATSGPIRVITSAMSCTKREVQAGRTVSSACNRKGSRQ